MDWNLAGFAKKLIERGKIASFQMSLMGLEFIALLPLAVTHHFIALEALNSLIIVLYVGEMSSPFR